MSFLTILRILGHLTFAKDILSHGNQTNVHVDSVKVVFMS